MTIKKDWEISIDKLKIEFGVKEFRGNRKEIVLTELSKRDFKKKFGKKKN